MLDPADLADRGGAVVGLVEDADCRAPQQPGRRPRRGRQLRAAGDGERAVPPAGGREIGAGMVAADQHRAPEAATAREAVDPGHRVAVLVVARRHTRHRVVEVPGALAVHGHVGGLDPQEPQPRGQHDPGEPHPAGRRIEQLVAAREPNSLARGCQELEPDHVVAEGAVAVMVLPVHVCGDRAADRDVPGTRRDRHEEAHRDEQLHELLDAHPGVDRRLARLLVDLPDGGQQRHREHAAAGVLRGVAVAAAEPARQRAARTGARERLGDVIRCAGLHDLRPARRGPAPAGQQPLVRLVRSAGLELSGGSRHPNRTPRSRSRRARAASGRRARGPRATPRGPARGASRSGG